MPPISSSPQPIREFRSNAAAAGVRFDCDRSVRIAAAVGAAPFDCADTCPPLPPTYHNTELGGFWMAAVALRTDRH